MTMWGSPLGCIVMLTLSMLLAPLASTGQGAAKVPLIGVLGTGFPASEAQRQQSPFLQKLRELGWHEGQNLVIERRFAEGKFERLPDLAADLVRLQPDVIVTGSTPGVRAAQQATTTIPIVMSAGQLVEQGIVASLAHPGGNITGVEDNLFGLSGRRFEILKEAMPQAVRVAFLCNPTNPWAQFDLAEVETTARALGLQLQRVEVRPPDAFDAAFATIVAGRPDALFVAEDATFAPYRQQIMDWAATHRLPTLSGGRPWAVAGSLIAYGYSSRALAQRLAIYVDKILKGAKPGDLPIERPMKFELIINLKTAEILGFTIPPTLLFQADEVIK
jgi:putative ABC transport system substrate-binding protein